MENVIVYYRMLIYKTFVGMTERDLYSWNVLIFEYAKIRVTLGARKIV